MPLHTIAHPLPARSTRPAGKTTPDMLLHRTNSRRKSTPGVRGSSAHHFPRSGHDGWDQSDFRCIRVRTDLSDHFVRTGLMIVAYTHWLAVVGAADSVLGSAES